MANESTPSEGRAIPVQSISGPTPGMTNSLRLLFLLSEIERQAAIFSDAMAEAVAAAVDRGNANDAWRHVQGAVFAAIVVNRLVTSDGPPPPPWPWLKQSEGRREAAAAASWRARELRRLLALPADETSTLIYGVRKVRNDLEHVDERLDLLTARPRCTSTRSPPLRSTPRVSHPSAIDLSDGIFLTSVEEVAQDQRRAGLRGFWPEGGLLLFDRSPLDLFALDLDMQRLRHNAREAQAEMLENLKGRLTFGGGMVRSYRTHPGDRLSWWQAQRAELTRTMAEAVDLDGYVRLWIRSGD